MSDVRILEKVQYALIPDEKLQGFVERMAKEEWEVEDFERYGEELHNSRWKLEEVELAKIKMRPELLASRQFQKELVKRIEKQRELCTSGIPIHPIILRGADQLIFDGYARVHFLKEIGKKRCLAYVGKKANKPKLYILCGLPFAGKTTFAKELVKRFGWVRVDIDEINATRGIGTRSNDEISDSDWKITYDESYRQIDEALRMRKTVINDTANFTKQQRDRLRAIANEYHVPTIVIYFNIPDEVARQRWQENRITYQRNDVTDADFAEVADNFEIPTEDENVVYFDGTTKIEKWIDEIFKN